MATRADNLAIDLHRAALAGDETARLLLDASWRVVDCSATAAELLASTPAALSGVCLRDRIIGPTDEASAAFDVRLVLGEPGVSAAVRVRPLRSQGQLLGYALQITSPRDVHHTRNERRCRALLAMLTTNVWLGTPDGQSADLLDLDAAPTAPRTTAGRVASAPASRRSRGRARGGRAGRARWHLLRGGSTRARTRRQHAHSGDARGGAPQRCRANRGMGGRLCRRHPRNGAPPPNSRRPSDACSSRCRPRGWACGNGVRTTAVSCCRPRGWRSSLAKASAARPHRSRR